MAMCARRSKIKACATRTTRAWSHTRLTTLTSGSLPTRLAAPCRNRGPHTATSTAKSSARATRKASATAVTTADGAGPPTRSKSGRAPRRCAAALHLLKKRRGTTMAPVAASTCSTAAKTALIASGAGLSLKAGNRRAPHARASRERSRSTSGAKNVLVYQTASAAREDAENAACLGTPTMPREPKAHLPTADATTGGTEHLARPNLTSKGRAIR